MSRSGYSDDYCDDQWAHIRWRGAVKSAIRGKRGQAFLKELAADLDAMPVKELVANYLVTEHGSVCALGCIAKARGIDVSDIDVGDEDYGYDESTYTMAHRLGIPRALAQEIVYTNDEAWHPASGRHVTPEQRWQVVRAWVEKRIAAAPKLAGEDP